MSDSSNLGNEGTRITALVEGDLEWLDTKGRMAVQPFLAEPGTREQINNRITRIVQALASITPEEGTGGGQRCAHCVAVDGPYPPGAERFWLARKLMDSKLTDAEAFGVVRHHPDISPTKGIDPDPPEREAVGRLRAWAALENWTPDEKGRMWMVADVANQHSADLRAILPLLESRHG